MELKLTTPRSKVTCSIDWANQMPLFGSFQFSFCPNIVLLVSFSSCPWFPLAHRMYLRQLTSHLWLIILCGLPWRGFLSNSYYFPPVNGPQFPISLQLCNIIFLLRSGHFEYYVVRTLKTTLEPQVPIPTTACSRDEGW